MVTAESVLIAQALLKSGVGKALREDLGLSADVFAGRVPTSPSSIRRWEAGQRRPRPEAACRYLEAITALSGLKLEVLTDLMSEPGS